MFCFSFRCVGFIFQWSRTKTAVKHLMQTNLTNKYMDIIPKNP